MSSQSFYYVLWIPQYKKENPHVIQRQLNMATLRDIPELPLFCVQGQIESDSYDIALKYSIGGEQLDKELFFRYIESDERGFVLYRLDLNEEQTDFLCNLLRTEMPNALYHYFKSFFHRHIFHEESEDSLLRPYFSSNPINWSETKVRNEIVKRLVEDYETKFNAECKEHSLTYEKIAANLQKRTRIRRMRDRMEDLCEHERDTLNERVYCNFLLRSFPGCIDKARKRQLKDTIAHLEVLALKSESSFNKLNSSLGLAYSAKGYYIGIIGVIVGLASAIWSLCYSISQTKKSTKDLKENIEMLKSIQKDIYGLKEDKQVTLEQVQQVNGKVDTLNREVRKIQMRIKQSKDTR